MLRPARTVAMLATGLVVACSSPGEAPSAGSTIELVQGPGEMVAPGDALGGIIVRVLDEAGDPVVGAPMTWGISGGGGTLANASRVSGVDGLASATWWAGPMPGPQQLAISVFDQPALQVSGEARALVVERMTVGFLTCGIRRFEAWCGGTFTSMMRALPGIQAVDVTQGFAQTCVLDPGGSVYCNNQPEVGGSQPVPGLPALRGIAVDGYARYCGLAAGDSTAWCWRPGSTPVQVSSTVKFRDLVQGDSNYRCGLDADGITWCWHGEASDPFQVNLPGVVALAVRNDEMCAATASQDIYCWQEASPQPYRVEGVRGSQLACATRTCMAVEGGTMLRTFDSRPPGDALPPGPSYAAPFGVMSIAGMSGICVQSPAGDVYCTGYNDLVDPRPTFRPVQPIPE